MSTPALKHTEGPWRWEFNREHKILHLVGGRPRQFDLTVMDFSRWGMGRAVASLRDTSEAGMNIMHRLCDRPDWIAPFPNRAHHASWCADVTHPDMRLMAAAPMLLEALILLRQMLAEWHAYMPHGVSDKESAAMEKARTAIAAAGQQP